MPSPAGLPLWIRLQFQTSSSPVTPRSAGAKRPPMPLINAVILEAVAKLAFRMVTLASDAAALERVLHDKHFLRKHGPSAYYGQT
jgi:L-ribulose-5-phosphate 4-epimerase